MSDLHNIISNLEQQRSAIERALAALRDVQGSGAEATPAKRRGRPPGQRSQMSEEGRANIAEGARRRWAEKRAAGGPQPRKRGLTAAGRKRLSDLMKARWASKNPPKPVARKRG